MSIELSDGRRSNGKRDEIIKIELQRLETWAQKIWEHVRKSQITEFNLQIRLKEG